MVVRKDDSSYLFKRAHRQGLKKILTNSGWMMGEQIVRMFVGLFVGVWIARYLGPYQFGLLSFAISYSSLFGIFATLGLNRIVVRELVNHADDTDYASVLMSTVFLMRLCAAICMFSVSVLIAWILGQGEVILVGIISAGFLFSIFDCIELFFQSKTAARVTVIARSFAFFFITLCKIALLIIGGELVAFALITLAEFAVSALALSLAYSLLGFKIKLSKVSWKLASQLMRESWPEIFAGFSVLIFMRMDQIMLENIKGPAAVGVFSVAARLSEAWYFVPVAIVSSAFPAIVRERQRDSKQYMRRIHQLLSGLVIISYMAIATITFSADWVIGVLYGPVYRESIDILKVHIWCGLLVSMGQASGAWIMAEGRPKLNLYRTILGALVNLVLNFILIPKMGGIGAALATMFSFFIAYFLADFFNSALRSIGLLKLKALFMIFP